MKWKCKRCEVIFTEDKRMTWKNGEIDCPCDCKKNGEDGPSPWELIEFSMTITSTPIKAKPRKFNLKWPID